MSAPARPAAAAAPEAAPRWQDQLGSAVKTMAMFAAVQYAIKYGMKHMGMVNPADMPARAPAPAGNTPAVSGASGVLFAGAAQAVTPTGPRMAELAWPKGTNMDMLVYISTAPTVQEIDAENPTIAWKGLTFGNWKDKREEDLILDVPEIVRADNGSWWMDILLVKDGGSPISRPGNEVASHRKELTRWIPKRRVRKEKSLLGKDGKEEESAPEDEEDTSKPPPVVSYWSPNVTLTIVSDSDSIDMNHVSAGPIKPFYHFIENEKGNLTYFPPIFPNDFWLLKEHLVQINETTKQLPLHISYHAISNMKFSIFASLTASFEQASQQQGSSAEFDEVKRMLTETNPILLVTTALVTVLHMLFEFLAFSSDVSHWKKKDKNNDMVGVSLNTILTNCVVQLVVLLYLHDSSEETSWMILFTQGIGLLIEAWKITKVVDVRVRSDPTSFIGYRIAFEDKHELSEDEKKTQEYDNLAFRLVSYFAGPVLLAYAGYSLMYGTHRSWYSFIITTLAQAIYMFGFVQLIPQLIINYKLKSVAHIPMKAMMYKTLSTVVDDFFAFCVKMPWLHRLACFRDDVCFVILLIQMRLYRVDYSRTNEYGQVGEEVAKDKIAASENSEAIESETESKKDK